MNEKLVKNDEGKPRLDLVPLECMIPLARVREFAIQKYGESGVEAWREIDDNRLLAALLRHTIEYQKNPDICDAESGLPAAYHMAINAIFLAIKTMERRVQKRGAEK